MISIDKEGHLKFFLHLFFDKRIQGRKAMVIVGHIAKQRRMFENQLKIETWLLPIKAQVLCCTRV